MGLDKGSVGALGLGILGFAIGGPLGGLAGTILGGLIWPPQIPTKVANLRLTFPQKGQVLPVLWGTQRLPGYYLWTGNFQQNQVTIGGKKGPGGKGGGKGGGGGKKGQEVTVYSASMALAICEGIEPATGTTTLISIWSGPDKVWSYDGSVGSGLDFSFYVGNPGQSADSEMAQYTAEDVSTGSSLGPLQSEVFNASGPTPSYNVDNAPIATGTTSVYYQYVNPYTGLLQYNYLAYVGASPAAGQYTVTGTQFLLGPPPSQVDPGNTGQWQGTYVEVQYQQAQGTIFTGVGAVAYPHWCYIVFHSFDLGTTATPPNFTFEISRIPPQTQTAPVLVQAVNKTVSNTIGSPYQENIAAPGTGNLLVLVWASAVGGAITQSAPIVEDINGGSTSFWNSIIKQYRGPISPPYADNGEYVYYDIEIWWGEGGTGPGETPTLISIDATNEPPNPNGLSVYFSFSEWTSPNGTPLVESQIGFNGVVGVGGGQTNGNEAAVGHTNDVIVQAAVSTRRVLVGSGSGSWSDLVPNLFTQKGFYAVGQVAGSPGGADYEFSLPDDNTEYDQLAAVFSTGITTPVQDVNPVFVVYDVLTNTRYGVGRPTTDIDSTSYAAVTTIVANAGLLCSPLLDRAQGALQWLNELLSLYDGYLYYSQGVIKFGVRTPATAEFTLNFDDFTMADLPQITRQGPKDTYNRLLLEYTNRASNYNQGYVKIDYDDDIARNGERQLNLTMRHVTLTSVAEAIAARIFLTHSTQKLLMTHGLNPSWGQLEQGDTYIVNAPGVNPTTVFRITSIEEDMQWGLRVNSIQDPVSLAPNPIPSFNSQVPVPSIGVPGPGQTANTVGMVVELPPQLSGYGNVRVAVMGFATGTQWQGCDVYISLDGVTYSFLVTLTSGVVAGVLRSAMQAPISLVDYEVVTIDGAESGSALPSTNLAGFNAQTLQLILGLIGSTLNTPAVENANVEWVAYETATLIAGNAYSVTPFIRGLYASTEQLWPAGTQAVLFNPSAVSILPVANNQLGIPIYFKFVTRALFGQTVVPTQPTFLQFTAMGYAFQPPPVWLLQVLNSNSQGEGYLTRVYVGVTPNRNVVATWSYQNPNLTDYLQLVQSAGTSSPVHIPTFAGYLVSVSSGPIGGALTARRQTTVQTESFTYTEAQNVADAGAFQRVVQLTVVVLDTSGYNSTLETVTVTVLG